MMKFRTCLMAMKLNRQQFTAVTNDMRSKVIYVFFRESVAKSARGDSQVAHLQSIKPR